MPDLINIRLIKDSPEIEAMDEAAKSLGMSRNEMILKAIGMMISFDKVFYKKLEAYSEKMKVPMWTALQNMTIKRWAQDSAKTAVWGNNPEVLIEFSTTEVGTIPPKELYEMAYQMAFDAEAKERIAALDKEIAAGIQLRNEEDKAFYEKYRYKYGTVQREQDEASFAFWESEMTDTEALKKFNWEENYMIKGNKIIAGELYEPLDNRYSMPADGIVVTTFKEHGWVWGGDWKSSKDYMHFSFLGK